MNNEFEKEDKYKLYRSVKEILHPTISKRNISNYKIIVDDNLLPLRIFYPQKVTNMNNVMIYIHGDAKVTRCTGKYSEISNYIAINTNNLVISIDSSELIKATVKQINIKIFEIVKYLYEELKKIDITNISLLGDSTGASTIINLKDMFDEEEINIKKKILFYPVLSRKYICKKNKDEKNFLDSLIIIGSKDENFEELKTITKNYYEISNMKHGFLKDKNEEIKKISINKIKEYLNEN